MHNPANKVFTASDFIPGEIRWDSFDVDPRKPHLPQMHEFNQDLMWVHFPNGCDLHIDWAAHPGSVGHFVVSLSQQREVQDWEPFEVRTCQSLPELRAMVQELVVVARERPPIL